MDNQSRQFVRAAFRLGSRPYTFHNDGEPVAVGDFVRVETRNGAQSAQIVGIEDGPPPFETKPVLGLAEPADSARINSSEEN